MGTIENTGKRGFIFLDTLIALIVLSIGLSGIFAGILTLNRFVIRERTSLVEAMQTANEIGTAWHDGP